MLNSTMPGVRALVLVILTGWMLGCHQTDDATPPPTPTVNVVLVSIDTLRPDHLGCYGYEAPTTPSLDRFCRDSVVFRQAIAQAPSTLHSHASMLSSLCRITIRQPGEARPAYPSRP